VAGAGVDTALHCTCSVSGGNQSICQCSQRVATAKHIIKRAAAGGRRCTERRCTHARRVTCIMWSCFVYHHVLCCAVLCYAVPCRSPAGTLAHARRRAMPPQQQQPHQLPSSRSHPGGRSSGHVSPGKPQQRLPKLLAAASRLVLLRLSGKPLLLLHLLLQASRRC
jgi:hypothetical protein